MPNHGGVTRRQRLQVARQFHHKLDLTLGADGAILGLAVLELQDDLPLLYLVDEIFRGTNNRERLIGSRSYIRTLMGADGVGLIATHGLEFAHLADGNTLARNYHFRDDVRNGRLNFYYQLRD